MFERIRRKSPDKPPSQPPQVIEESEASVDVDSSSYPGVRRSMEGLSKIIERRAQDGELHHTPSGEPIVTGKMIDDWMEKEGYEHRKRGTYRNGDTYVYFKPCNLIEDEGKVDEALGVARDLTNRGAIHPESQWGVAETGENAHVLFVVSPKLETWAEEEVPEGQASRLPDKMSLLFDWFQRVDPNFVPDQPIPEDSPLHHLSWPEASHLDNWGWDETGRPYPVDVEVIHPQEPTHKNYEPWKPTTHPEAMSYFYDF